ncbi:hypothetical protein DFP73DRAFT_526406 [Morchella snyderi]|nr:hypothetical protein DFP73DRAFT_526406 [Morchella snyderi]
MIEVPLCMSALMVTNLYLYLYRHYPSEIASSPTDFNLLASDRANQQHRIRPHTYVQFLGPFPTTGMEKPHGAIIPSNFQPTFFLSVQKNVEQGSIPEAHQSRPSDIPANIRAVRFVFLDWGAGSVRPHLALHMRLQPSQHWEIYSRVRGYVGLQGYTGLQEATYSRAPMRSPNVCVRRGQDTFSIRDWPHWQYCVVGLCLHLESLPSSERHWVPVGGFDKEDDHVYTLRVLRIFKGGY